MGKGKTARPKVKEPVKIRFKKLSNGNQSIYLARWNNSSGKWEYEFLKNLYIVPDSGNATLKDKNTETLRLAKAIQAKRIVELQNSYHGFSNGGTREKVNVIEYIRALAEKKRIRAGGGKRTTAMKYIALTRQIEDYSGLKTTFKQVDKKYCTGFIEHIKTAKNKNNGQPLNENTQAGYIKIFEAVLNTAISDEVIITNYFKQIKPENKPKIHKTEIVYLTIDEVNILENTACLNQSVKQAFLFSCYTGLRFSDVKSLTWGKLQKDGNGVFIDYIQRKTRKHELLPIPQKALEYLPAKARKKEDCSVFELPSGGYTNHVLKAWALMAGITKHLTFHVSRRSCATNLLTLGARMEVVSKILAHSDIRTTQAAYGVIQNQLQREAMNLFDKLNGLTD